MVTDEEREIFGVMGRFPDVILKASVEIVIRYKNLAEEANKVAMMKPSHRKELAAKDIEHRYYALVDEAMKELDRKGIKYEPIERPQTH
jgi:ribosome-associated translation inhibitor RaiA